MRTCWHDEDDETEAANWTEFKECFVSAKGTGTAFADLTMAQQNILDDYRIAQEHNGAAWKDDISGSVICMTQEYTRLSDFATVDSYQCDSTDCNMWKNLKILAMEDNGSCTPCLGCNDEDEKLYLALCDAQSGQNSVADLPVDSTGTASYRVYDETVYPESIYAQ